MSRGGLGLTQDFQQNQWLQEGEVLSGQEVGTASIRRQWGLWVWKVDKVVAPYAKQPQSFPSQGPRLDLG